MTALVRDDNGNLSCPSCGEHITAGTLGERWEENRPSQIAARLGLTLGDAPREEMHLLCFDADLCVMSDTLMYKGQIDHVELNAAEMFHVALRQGAYAIAVAHNHPGGDATPSEGDVEATEQLMEACKLIGLRFLDHLVISRNGYESVVKVINKKTTADIETFLRGLIEKGLIEKMAQGESLGG
jgi:DNA repair protein RadC